MWATQLGVSVDKPVRSIDYSGTDDNNNSSFKIKTKEKKWMLQWPAGMKTVSI